MSLKFKNIIKNRVPSPSSHLRFKTGSAILSYTMGLSKQSPLNLDKPGARSEIVVRYQKKIELLALEMKRDGSHLIVALQCFRDDTIPTFYDFISKCEFLYGFPANRDLESVRVRFGSRLFCCLVKNCEVTGK